MSLGYRLSAYEELWSRFGFLCKLDVLIPNMRSNERLANKLDRHCLPRQCFGNEVLQFVDFSNEILDIDKDHFLYKLISVHFQM